MKAQRELVTDFVNTLELDEQVEHLATPGELQGWLAERGLIGARSEVTRADLRRAREVREALRSLMLANNGVAVDTRRAARTIDRAAGRAGVRLRFTDRARVRLQPDRRTGVDAALGSLLGQVAELMTEGSWARLKACRAEDCRWAFYDQAKNVSRAWCSMQVCGNREKARVYRRRHARG
jgi:predicted RNA-binding Zn ribbon-like protein